MEHFPTTLPREVACQFFLTFARFEFALKNSGFLGGDHRYAKPNWKDFAASLREMFDKEAAPDLAGACDYLLLNPPLQQVVWENQLKWDPGVPEHQSEVELLLYLVQRVRNNLFHGGKHQAAGIADFPPDSERKCRLVESSLCVLHWCLQLSPSVRAAYETAAL